MTTLKGSFEVASWDEIPYDERDGRRLTKALVTQRFSGAVSGEGSAEWLMSYNEDATARFVGLQLVDGEIAGAINRRPGEGEIRSNLAAGGTAEPAELTDTEHEICAALAPELKRRGLLFVGIDVIGGRWLTEINVTSPTGIVAVDKFNGTDTPGLIWNAIERKLKN